VISDEDRQQGHGPTHEHPVLCARICNKRHSISSLRLQQGDSRDP
jgi:hypothetical protein